MQTVNKPTIQQLIDGFNHIYDNTGLDRFQIEDEDVATTNWRALVRSQYEDYNIENFHRLIQAIEFDGLSHFNMTTFLANIKDFDKGEYGNDDYTPVNNLTLNYSSVCSNNVMDVTTKSFNCDSVGCVAGFATAVALDWKQPGWMKSDSREYLNFFEHMACNYLNIPLEVGRRIFYDDSGSVWAFVRFYEPETYGAIAWKDMSSDIDCNDYDYDDQWEDLEVDLSTIDYKAAVDVLNRIASGEIRFNDRKEHLPYYKKDRK